MLTPFGKVLRRLRDDRGMRLLELAERLGHSSAYVSGVETGRKPIPDGYVTSVIKAMDLTTEEARELRKAADKTRKEVRVDALSEDQRALVAALARRLDEDATDDPKFSDALERLRKVLRSTSGEVPFRRKRRGIVVPAASAKSLRSYAERVRNIFVVDDQIQFPIIDVLERSLARAIPDFCFDVVEKQIMGDDEGRVIPGTMCLFLRVDVYEAACHGNGRARFTACHELGHFLLHRDVGMARARDDGIAIYRDSEWQADTFAGALMMSKQHFGRFFSPADAARQCGMSGSAAEHQFKIYKKEQL